MTLIDLDKFDKIRRRHKENNDQLQPWQTGRTLSLRERNLRGASLDRSDLRNVDFFGAELQGASLKEAQLQGAELYEARLQGASLESARLQGASFSETFLWRARGKPNPGYPVRVWVINPQLQAMTAKELAKLEKDALAGVEGDHVKKRILKALAQLSMPAKETKNDLPENYWINLIGKVSKEDH